MTLTINRPDIDWLVRELAELTGENPDEAVHRAVRERLERSRRKQQTKAGSTVKYYGDLHPDPKAVKKAIANIQEEVARLPVIDDRTPDELLGYDENGLPS